MENLRPYPIEPIEKSLCTGKIKQRRPKEGQPCNYPLRQINGGNMTVEGSTQHFHVFEWGCMNDDCELSHKVMMVTQTEPQESFVPSK